MKFVTYKNKEEREEVGFIYEEKIIPLEILELKLPEKLIEILSLGSDILEKIDKRFQVWKTSDAMGKLETDFPFFNEVQLLAPIPKPSSFRDAYAFRQHVETSRRNRGLEMISEFDEFPVFYFSNHHAITGPGDVIVQEDHLNGLDFELEVAIVIGKKGANIKAQDADDYIAGFMILNDWSARNLQMQEMKLNLGPAKGKDFASSMGPFLITPDELKPFLTQALPGHVGNAYQLKMEAFHNGKLISLGNLSSMNWTFAEIIERISYGVTLYPGDVIGSGTVGTGCLLEINGTQRLENPQHVDQWLKPGDQIELKIEQLGVLSNTLILKK